MTDKDKQRQALPERRTMTLRDKDYQPRKAGQEEEYDMPGAALSTVRSAFFRPFAIKRKNQG